MKKTVVLMVILLFCLCFVSAYAGGVDTFSDLSKSIISSETDWLKENTTQFDIEITCDSGAYKASFPETSTTDSIVDVDVDQGSVACLTNAVFNCVKNDKSIIVDRDVRHYCSMYVHADSDESLVTLEDDMYITFNGVGDVSIIVQYAYQDILHTGLKQPKAMVRYNFHIFSTDSHIELYGGPNESALPSKPKPTGLKIHKLQHLLGSYLWDDTNDCSVMDMIITIPNKADFAISGNFTVSLPDGFSARKDEIVSTSEAIEYYIEPQGESEYAVQIYPIYSEEISADGYLHFGIHGDHFDWNERFPIEEGKHNKATIYMRPTTGVNKHDNEVFKKEIDLIPRTDFFGSSTVYSDRLAMLGSTLSQAVYNVNHKETVTDTYIHDSLRELGFGRYLWNPNNSLVDPYSVADAFATKRIIKDGEIFTIVIVCVRGTVDKEWIGNFDVSDDTYHANFQKCYEDLKEEFEWYKNETGLKTDDHTKLFICGHSRGGAVADIFAHNMNKIYDSKNVFAYTFAAPNTTREKFTDKNIHNLVYKYDFVGFVPHLNYHNYGVTYLVGGKDNNTPLGEVGTAFKQFTHGTGFEGVGDERMIQTVLLADRYTLTYQLATMLQNFIGGIIANPDSAGDSFIARAHGAENYVAWTEKNGISGYETISAFEKRQDAIVDMKLKYKQLVFSEISKKLLSQDDVLPESLLYDACERSDTVLSFASIWYLDEKLLPMLEGEKYGRGMRICLVACPVNTEVKDGEGNVVAEIKNHKVVSMDKMVMAYSIDDEDLIILPAGMEYSFSITGTDKGTMTIESAYLNATGDCEDTFAMKDIPVHSGEVFTMKAVVRPNDIPVVTSNRGMVYTSEYPDNTLLLPADLTSIEDEAFAGLEVEKVVIPASCEYVGHRAFANCKSLKIVQFIDGDNVDVEEDFLKGSPNARIVAPEGSYMAAW